MAIGANNGSENSRKKRASTVVELFHLGFNPVVDMLKSEVRIECSQDDIISDQGTISI